MKLNFAQNRCGLARLDILVAVVLVIFLFMLLLAVILPVYEAARRNDEQMNCLSNLKQIGLALRISKGDRGTPGGPLPSETDGLNDAQTLWVNRMGISDIVDSTKLLQCPTDKETPPTTNALGLKIRISYFLNLDASRDYPQMIMSGDDNLAVGCVPVKSGILNLSPNMPVAWLPGRHGLANNLGFADGSVSEESPSGLQNAIQYSFNGTPFPTNRIAIP